MLTAEQARQIWRYEPETGKFFWLVTPKSPKRYNVQAGDKAGTLSGKYNYLSWKCKHYKCGRVAWLMMTGKWPVQQIDHINGIRADDRFCNLREATSYQNCCNRGIRSDNELGLKGVSQTPSGYAARIIANGKKRFIGSFKTAEAAKLAYNEAAAALHGEYANTGDF